MILYKQPKAYVIAVKGVEVSEMQVGEFVDSANRFNWNVEIFWGINGYNKNIDSIAREMGIKQFHDEALNCLGMKGCLLSHFTLWKESVDTNTPLIIFEHDAVINSKWRPIEVGDYILKLHPIINVKERIHYLSGLWTSSAYAYYIPPSQASKLVDFTIEYGLPSDVVMGDKVIDLKHFDDRPMVHRNTIFSTTRQPGIMYNNSLLSGMVKSGTFNF